MFGRRLRACRDQHEMTQRDLAERMQGLGHDWHQNTVARTESGARAVRLDEAAALAGIFRVPLPEFLTSQSGRFGTELARLDRRISSGLLVQTSIRARLLEAQAEHDNAQAAAEAARARVAATAEALDKLKSELRAAQSRLDGLYAERAQHSEAAHTR